MLYVKDRNNAKVGAILAYVFIFINSIYSLVVTPYIVGKLGEADYGVYKTIASLSASIFVLDMGLGSTVTRYIALYKARHEDHKIEPFISMAVVEGSFLIALVLMVCFVVYGRIPHVYSETLDVNQINIAQQLFIVLSLNICFHIIENLLNGIIAGYNKFVFANGLKLFRIIIRILSTVVLVNIYRNSYVLVAIDLTLTLLLTVSELIYINSFLRIGIRISIKGWNKGVFFESFKYTVLMFLTSIAAQVNGNLDNVVIGAEMGAPFVTIYSMGLIVFAMFESLSTAVSGVMLPTITNSLAEDETGEKAKRLVISAGRVQFLLLGAVFAGFIVLGKEFIQLWLGAGFSDVYLIVLILMGPSLLELCVNVCLSILTAKNMLWFRTTVLMSSTVLNAIVTIIGVRLFGYYAAAIGTGISFLVGSVIIMNIYYLKRLNINMLEVYGQIFKGIWICILLAAGVTWLISTFGSKTWLHFALSVFSFGIVYFVLLYFCGLNSYEKKMITWRKKDD